MIFELLIWIISFVIKISSETEYFGKIFVLQSIYCFKVERAFNNWLYEKPLSYLYPWVHCHTLVVFINFVENILWRIWKTILEISVKQLHFNRFVLSLMLSIKIAPNFLKINFALPEEKIKAFLSSFLIHFFVLLLCFVTYFFCYRLCCFVFDRLQTDFKQTKKSLTVFMIQTSFQLFFRKYCYGQDHHNKQLLCTILKKLQSLVEQKSEI